MTPNLTHTRQPGSSVTSPVAKATLPTLPDLPMITTKHTLAPSKMESDLAGVNARYESIFASNRSTTVGTPLESELLAPVHTAYLSEVDFESTLLDSGVFNDVETNLSTRPDRVAAVEISPHGDLVLELTFKRGLARYRVSSQVLCLASPVFRAMLGPNSSFREACELRTHTTAGGGAANAEPYTLPLEEDDPEALAIVLFALHLQNSKLPTFIKEKRTIWNMAIICDKYDCTSAFSVWVDGWAEQWRRRAIKNSGHGLWVFISWTFGLGDVFAVITKKIILEGYYQVEGGKFLSKEGWNLDGLAIPSPVMEMILQQRRTTILTMIEDALSIFDKFLAGGQGQPICSAIPPNEECDLIILGSLTREYQIRLGLYPEHNKYLLMSVRDVYEKLRSLTIRTHSTHSHCGNFRSDLFTRLDLALGEIVGLDLEQFASRQGLPVRRMETGAGRGQVVEEAYTPSLTLIKKLFYPKRRQPSSTHLA